MEEVKTYSNRNNARRAGVQAGIPSEQVELTVHKSPEGVRFGWKQKPLPTAVAPTEPTLTTVVVETAAAPKAKQAHRVKVPRIEQNGVKRPAPGGLCAAIWDWLDANAGAALKEAKAVAADHSWNVNNMSCEYYQWRRFHTAPAARTDAT